MPFNGFGFLVGTILAEREGVSSAAATRIGLVGGLLGFSATGLIATSILARREAESESAQAVIAGSGGTSTPTLVAVPNVTGKSFDDANKLLTGQGFVVQRQDAFSGDAPKDQVFEIAPPVGTLVNPGSTIILTVSVGPVPAPTTPGQVTVPNVSDGSLTFDQAREKLQNETLGVADPIFKQVDNSKQAGMVIDQNPPAGTVVSIPTKVSLTVGALQSAQVSSPADGGSVAAASQAITKNTKS